MGLIVSDVEGYAGLGTDDSAFPLISRDGDLAAFDAINDGFAAAVLSDKASGCIRRDIGIVDGDVFKSDSACDGQAVITNDCASVFGSADGDVRNRNIGNGYIACCGVAESNDCAGTGKLVACNREYFAFRRDVFHG